MQVRASVSRTCTNLDARRNRDEGPLSLSVLDGSAYFPGIIEDTRTSNKSPRVHYNFEINARGKIAKRGTKKRKKRPMRHCASMITRDASVSASIGMSPIRVTKICVYLKVGKYISLERGVSLVYEVCISNAIARAII